jgi:hypothetical protein
MFVAHLARRLGALPASVCANRATVRAGRGLIHDLQQRSIHDVDANRKAGRFMAAKRADWRQLLVGVAVLSGLLGLLAQPAVAGPPFLSDDPQPTDTGHFEIYTFNNGTNTRAGTSGEAGIDFNYGAATDLQLTATLPQAAERAWVPATSNWPPSIDFCIRTRSASM